MLNLVRTLEMIHIVYHTRKARINYWAIALLALNILTIRTRISIYISLSLCGVLTSSNCDIERITTGISLSAVSMVCFRSPLVVTHLCTRLSFSCVRYSANYSVRILLFMSMKLYSFLTQ